MYSLQMLVIYLKPITIVCVNVSFLSCVGSSFNNDSSKRNPYVD